MTRTTIRGAAASLLTLAVLAGAPAVAAAAAPEAPVTEAPSALTGTTATFNGVLNPGEATGNAAWHFAYNQGEECAGGPVVPAGPPFPEAEGNHNPVTAPVTGLEAATPYSVCLVAANPAEESEQAAGGVIHFTTPASTPVVVAESTTGLTPYAATLDAEVNPENQTTTGCSFEYGKTIGEHKLPCEQLQLSGSSPQTATRALNGLSPATKYHYRVVVKNATGETKGPAQEFETPTAQAPLIASENVSGITPFQARLEAVLNPDFESTKCDFTYGLAVAENTVGCEPGLLEGFGEQPVGATVTGLTPATVYHYRVLARNATGETQGTEQEFTTLALQPPTIASEAAVAVTPTDAQLEARINPNWTEASYVFEYSTEETAVQEGKGTQLPVGNLPAAGEEVTAGPLDIGGGLKPGTVYFYRVTAHNGGGDSEGPVQQFETSPAQPPTIITETASAVTETGVSFEATVNPNSQESTYAFQYATDEAFTENLGEAKGKRVGGAIQESAFPAVNEELSTGPVAATGLKPGTVYYYRVVAANPIMGTTDGPTQSFGTLAKPAVETGEAIETTRTTATVEGEVNPGGAATTYRVVYVTDAGYLPGAGECQEGVACAYAAGVTTTSRSLFATGYEPETAGPITLEELKPGTTYHYAILATNSTGTTVGPDETFTTEPATPPVATTGAAGAIGQSTATITGTVDTRGLATTIRFLIGTEPSPDAAIATAVTGQAGTIDQVTGTLEGLQPATTYYYRVTATNPDGTAEGKQGTFTTAGVPAAFTAPPAVALLPYTPIATLNAKEAAENQAGSHSHSTRPGQLAKALKACRRKHGHKRAVCERKAHKRYGHAARR